MPVPEASEGALLPTVPDPSSLAIQFLVWLGLPALMIAAIQSALALLGWLTIGRRTIGLVRTTRGNAARMASGFGRTTMGYLLKTALSGGFFMALTYAAAQVVDFVMVRNYGVSSASIETISNVEYLVSQIFSYSTWTPLSRAAFLAAGGYVVLVNLAYLIGMPSLAWVARGPWWVVLMACRVAGLLGAVVGLIVLLNAVLNYAGAFFGGDDNGYKLQSVALYAMFAGFGFGMPWLANRFEESSEGLWAILTGDPGRRDS